MKIDINQEVLCEFCGKEGGAPPNSMCEGRWCAEEHEKYLECHGIVINNKVSFGSLSIGDSIFEVTDGKVPTIFILKVNSMSQLNTGGLTVHYNSSSFCIQKEHINDCSNGQFHLDRKGAEEALKKLCMDRIIEIATVLGSIQ
jgi:hypothetical protein